MAEIHGKTITDENGERYFYYGNTRTRIVEYFKEDGKTLSDAIGDLIVREAMLRIHKK